MKTEEIQWRRIKDELPPDGISVLICFKDRSIPICNGYRNNNRWYPVPRHMLEQLPYTQDILGWAYFPTGECLRPVKREKVAS